MPAAISRYGGKIHLAGSHANAYDQWFTLEDGTLINVVTIKVGDEPDAEYIDMTPDVAQKLFDDLFTAIPNSKRAYNLGPSRHPKVRVRRHQREVR